MDASLSLLRRLIPTLILACICFSWTFAQPAKFDPPQLLSNGVKIRLLGPVGASLRVDAASEVPFWSAIEQFTATATTNSFIDTQTNAATRFYRAVQVADGLKILRIHPLSGVPGDQVVIEGQFFKSGKPAEHTLTFGGVDAVIESATGARLVTHVPAAARSGPVMLRTQDSLVAGPSTFTVLTRAPVQVLPPGNLPISAYLVVNTYGDSTGGLLIRNGVPLLSLAVPTNNPNGTLMAMSVEPTQVLVFSAASSAEALVFMTPAFRTSDPDAAKRLLAAIHGEPKVAVLAQLMAGHFAVGKNPVDQPDFPAAFSNAVFGVLAGGAAQLSLAVPVKRPQTGQVKAASGLPDADFPVDADWIEVSRFNAAANNFIDELVALAQGKVAGKVLGPRERIVKRGQSETYPYGTTVDWVVRVDEVDVEKAFPGGPAEFAKQWQQADSRMVYPIRETPPGATNEDPFPRYGSVGGKTFNDVTVPVKTIAGYVYGKIVDALNPPDDKMTFPDRDALYLVTAVSPSFASGAEADTARANYRVERNRAIMLNLIGGTFDTIAVLLDLKVIDIDPFFKELLAKVVLEAEKKLPAITSLADMPPAILDLGKFVVQELADEAKNHGIEKAFGEALEAGEKVVAANFAKTLGPVLKALDIGGAIGQIALRITGTALVSPLETTFVMVGDPFKFEFLDITPALAQPGDQVIIRFRGPNGLAPFGSKGTNDTVEFRGPDFFEGEVKSAAGPDPEGVQTLVVQLSPGLPSTFDGNYEVTVATSGRVARGSFRLSSRTVVDSVSPTSAFGPSDSFSGAAFAGDRISLRGLNFNRNDRFFCPSSSGEILPLSVFDNSPDGDVYFNIPKGMTTGPVRVVHVLKSGATQTNLSPVVTILGPPVIESLTPTHGPVGTAVLVKVQNLGNSESTVTGKVGGKQFQSYKVAGDMILLSLPAGAVTGDLIVETPAGKATNTFTVDSGLSSGATIQVGGNSPISLEQAAGLANGDLATTQIPQFDDDDGQDPPLEAGDFITDLGPGTVPLRYPVGAAFRDTIAFITPFAGNATIPLNRDAIQGSLSGTLVVEGSFNSINLAVEGTLVVRGNNNNFNRPTVHGTLILEGDNNTLTSPTFSDGSGPGLVVRGNGNRVTIGKFMNKGGDALRVEGGKFNQFEVTICTSNLGNGIVLTEGAEGNTIQYATGRRDGASNFMLPGTGNAGHGLLLLGNARNNSIRHFTGGSSANAGDGIRLDGPGVTGNNFDNYLCSANGGNGVSIANGASANSFNGSSISNVHSGFVILASNGNELSSTLTANGEYGLLLSHVDDRAMGKLLRVASGLFETDGTNGRAGVRLEDGTQGVRLDTSIGDLKRNFTGLEVVGSETRFNSLNVVTRLNVKQGAVVVDASNNDFIFKIADAGENGLEFRGAHNNTTHVFDIENSGGAGIFLSGAYENHFVAQRPEPFASFVNGRENGIVVAKESRRNLFERLTVSSSNGAGLVLRDPYTSFNQIIRGSVNGSHTDGIQILGGASRNRIGDDRPSPTNIYRLAIQGNLNSGVRVSGLGTDDNEIRFGNFSPNQKQNTAIIIEDQAAGTVVLSNQFLSSPIGVGIMDYAVMVRNGAQGGRIVQNGFSQLGLRAVLVENASDVIIGGPDPADANSFADENLGIELTGTQTHGVRVANNRFSGNKEDAIRISDGAHHNEVGPGNTFDQNPTGVTVFNAHSNRISGNTISGVSIAGVDLEHGSTGNLIFANTITKNPAGIRAVGATTLENSFLDNSITANTGKGISLEDLANNGIKPPKLTEFLGDVLYGEADAPNGSLVQVFRDPDDEGAQKLGEALVSEGKFRLALALDPLDVGRLYRINATVTDTDGNTSEFSGSLEGEVPLLRLVWVSTRDGNPELYLRDSANPNPLRLTSNPAVDEQPRLSRDGTQVVFVSNRAGNREIYRQEAKAGLSPARLTTNAAADYDPDWSPDGTKIVFTSDRGGSPALFMMNADGSKVTALLPDGISGRSPAWSPNGQQIVFAQITDGRSQLATFQVIGGAIISLIVSSANDTHPAWSMDGESLAFVSDRDGDEEIYTARADGTLIVRITSRPGIDRDPTWLPDGRGLVFTSGTIGDLELFTTEAAGGVAAQMTVSAGDNSQPTTAAQ